MTGQAVIGALRADLILNTAQLGASANEAMRTFDRLKGRMDGLSGAADKSGRAFNGSLKSGVGSAKASFSAINSEMEKLRARFDPLSVATQKYEQELRDLKTAQVALGLSSEQVAAQHSRLAANFEFNKQAINGFGSSAQQAGFHATNLGFQFQDIAVMLASGQSPFTLAMQQGMQVSGIFQQMGGTVKGIGPMLAGALGSIVSPLSLITVGAIAAGSALFYWLTGSTEKAKTLDESLGDLSGAVGELKSITDLLSDTDLSGLRDQYGSLNQEILNLLDAQRQFAINDAVQGSADAMSASVSAMNGWITSELDGIKSAFDTTIDNARRLQSLMENVQNASTPEEALEATQALREQIESTIGPMGSLRGEAGNMARALVQSELNLKQAVVQNERLEKALARATTQAAALSGTSPANGWMGPAIRETNLLIGRLIEARNQKNALLMSAAGANYDKELANTGQSSGPDAARTLTQFKGGAFAARVTGAGLAAAIIDGGSSGGGSSKLSNAQKAIEKTADEVKKLNEAFEAGETPIAKFRAELKKLDDLKLKGLSDGAYAAGVAKLTQELGKSSIIGKLLGGGGLGSIWDDFKTQGKDAWSGLLTDAFSKGGGGFKAISSGLSTAFKSVGSMFTGGGMMAGLAGAMPIVGAMMGGLNLLKGLIGGTTDTDTGFKGQITNGGLDLQKYTDKHWSGFFGLMNNRWTETEAASASITGPLSAASNKIQGEVIKMADRLGFGADSFKNFTYKIDVSLKGLSEDQALEKLKSALSGMGDAFASVVPSIESMQELSSAFNERLSIDRQILQLKGDEAALRQMDIEATHDLNKARLAELHALQDTAKAADEAAKAADEMAAAVAKLSPEMFATALDFARAQNRAAVGLRVVGGTDLTPTQAESVAQNGFGLIAGSSLQMTMVKLLNVLQSVQSEGGDSLRVEAV